MNRFPILILSVLFLANGCKKDSTKLTVDDLSLYQEFVSEVSHGIISQRSDIRLVLKTPVDEWQNGVVLDKNIMVISPSTNGKVVILDQRTLSFVPEAHLKPDTEYQITVFLDQIIKDVPKELRSVTFGVKTQKQQFAVYTNPLQSYTPNQQYLEGQLRSADVMDLETAKSLISVNHNGASLGLQFDTSVEAGTQFYFKIDSIQRFDEDTKLEIIWDGTKNNIESNGQSHILIPGKNNFSVLNVVAQSTDNQVVLINFSDPIQKSQDFKGLVVLEGDGEPKFSVDGNTLKVYPSQSVTGTKNISVFQGIESVEGRKLKASFEERIAFEAPKPEVRMLSNGSILPSSHNLKINFEAVNLKAVDVAVYKIYSNTVLQFLQENNLNGDYNLRNVARPIASQKIELQGGLANTAGKWAAHALDLKTLITPEMGAIYRVVLNYRPSYSLYHCNSTNFSEASEEQENYDKELESSAWDSAEAYYDYGYYDNYDWNERDNPCHTTYYVDKKVGINVLASDLGVIVKKNLDNTYFVAVNDLLSTNPVAGVKITFYNFQQQVLGATTTDGNGTATMDMETTAYFAVADYNGQKTYIKLSDGNALSVSKFDVSGVALQKGLKGFIFGERGVWRPGETLYLSFLLNDKTKKLPDNHPVTLELLDPYYKVAQREVITLGEQNYHTFKVKTDENAPTGNWTAKVTVGGATFTKNIKIETIKPNRLKINTFFSDEVLSNAKPIQAKMEVQWLHGAVAKSLKADITARFSPKTTSFKAFTSYVFDDPTRIFPAEDQVIFKGKLNEAGITNFTLSPKMVSKAPGMLKAVFMAKVYENGGDFSTDVFTKSYSPFKTYVGLKAPKGDEARGMLLTDVKHLFEVATVDENGKPKATTNLKVTVHKIHWRWWWETGADNLSEYSSGNYREKVFEQTINTNDTGKTTFNFELKYPNWGSYLVTVEDPNGGHATGKDVYIDWPGWAGKSQKNDPSAATMLAFSTDKETYQVGETATVTFPSSDGGRALVTVENGSKLLESLWVETQKGETIFKLPIKEGYTPNVYLHITLLQPHATTLNDLPIRLYGMVPIMVENPDTKLQPEIEMPKILRPEERVTVNVKEKQGKPMTYTVAIVDEGLLDLTRFKTPNPWDAFFAREALGVKTWDIYDEVIGAFGGRIDQVFAIGGDEDLAAAKNKKANRFEPMVVFLGPFSLKAGETQAHKIEIPKYIGSVRTMVVAGDVLNEAYGMAEQTTLVRKPLMVLASLPRKITPGEKVSLPVTVFAMEGKVKEVTITLKEDKAFRISGPSSQKLNFIQPDEKIVYFDLEVADFEGIGKVVVEAKGHGEIASFEIPIDVVNPNPTTTSVRQIILEARESEAFTLETFGIAGSNEGQVEFSTLPPMNFNGRMQYLIQYPHGCVEQTTAAAFPQLFLTSIFEVTANKKNEIQQNVENAIRRLGNHQLPNGGFSYWMGESQANDWGTSFAGHFLLEAEKNGYVLPIGFKSGWVSYQQSSAKQWRSGNGNSDLAQAYRLYTLALSGNADIASMNRLREIPNISNESKFRLAATYGLVGQSTVAQQLLADSSISFKKQKSDYHTYGSEHRNRAMALETYVMLQDKSKAKEVAKTVAEQLASNDWLSTQTTSFSLLAMAKFAAMVGGKGIKASITINGKNESINTEKTLSNSDLAIKNGSNAIVLKNEGDNTVYVNILTSGILPVGEEREQQRNLLAKTQFKGRDGSVMDIAQLPQGTDFVAEVTLTNKTGNDIKDIALQEIFPSGWEIVNTRFTDFGEFAQNEVTHTDLRDDRANFYFDLKENESKTLRVLLNASYLGRYYLPGIQAEAMYNNDYSVRTKGRWVEVVQ